LQDPTDFDPTRNRTAPDPTESGLPLDEIRPKWSMPKTEPEPVISGLLDIGTDPTGSVYICGLICGRDRRCTQNEARESVSVT